MNGRIWPLSGIVAACPRCKRELDDMNEAWVCRICAASYDPVDGGLYRLVVDEGRGGERKESVKRMFTAMHQTLEANGLSRFSTFVNWGYATAEDGQGTGAHSVGRSSIRLLREAIGDICVQGKDVLEIACGRGGNVAALSKAYGPRSVVGVDLTEANVLFCQARNRLENVYFCNGDAEQLPIGTSCCDIVLTVEAADLFPEPERFYDEVHRVLKPGGTFICADDLPLPKWEAGERCLLGLGFDFVYERDISENVLLSSDLASARRYATLQSGGVPDSEVLDTIGLPGTTIYDEMRAGTRQYKLTRFVKRC